MDTCHCGVRGNELAHASARALLPRDSNFSVGTPALPDQTAHLTTYTEILQNQRLARRKYPPPHPQLSKAAQVAWRRLQTLSYPNPHILSKIDPDKYPSPTCRLCNTNLATLYHMAWECQCNTSKTDFFKDFSRDGWEAALSSPDRGVQEALVARARTGAQANGIPD